MKRVLAASLILVGCSTLKHETPVSYPPIKVESIIKDTNHAFEKLSTGLYDSVKAVVQVAHTPEAKQAAQDLKVNYDFMTTVLKDNLFTLENQTTVLQDRVSSLELTKSKLDVENHALSTANTTLVNKNIEQQSLITKWRTVGISCISALLLWLGLKIYSMFSISGVAALIKKFF